MSEDSHANSPEKPGHFLAELKATFAAQPGACAIMDNERSVSYGELDTRAARFAAKLALLGVEPGDRVAIATPEKRSFLAAHLGALYAGAISLPLNPRYTTDELRYFLEDSGARVAVVGDQPRPLVESLQGSLPDLRTVLDDRAAWNAPQGSFSEPAISSEAPCLMIYSSGTTGRPKGVVHTQANLAASIKALQSMWRFTADDVVLNVLPLFHVHGLSFGAHLSLLTGCRILLEESFQTRRTLDALSRATVFLAIPTFYYNFLDEPDFSTRAPTWSHVRLFTCGSAPIRAEVLPGLEAVLNRPVINRYGMTEAHVITSLPLDGPWPQGSVGIPLCGIELRVQKDDGNASMPGEVGSVRIRGPNLFREYWHQPEATRDAFSCGWFDTGDLGYRDVNGFLTLVGRKHDLIITNGYNVYPQVVERVIGECPGVRECAVVGLPDRMRGERVAAAVVPKGEALTEAGLRSYLRDRLIHYQRPVDIVFVAALPRNTMGKILRRELRAQISPRG
jgi:malonyl-CoA/methylmalonyl-CoA synthetase